MQIDYLNCNLNKHIFKKNDEVLIKEELKLYNLSLNDESNYNDYNNDKEKQYYGLEKWKKSYNYHDKHPHHKFLIDNINELIKTIFLNKRVDILDFGCGPGCLSKWIYYDNIKNNINLHCIDNYNDHIQQTIFNFQKETKIISPFIDVSANIIKGSIHELDIVNKYDIIFTCTVLMHIPFISAIGILKKLASFSKGYIIHIENLSGCVVKGKTKSNLQHLSIDYIKKYKLLGFTAITNNIIFDPHVSKAKYGYYIFKKNN